MKTSCSIFLLLFCVGLCTSTLAQPKGSRRQPSKPSAASAPRAERKTASVMRPNLAKEPTLYVVGYAHLDTEWRWEYPQVINEYIRKTMEDNFKLFDKYPHYIFNFSGANRYRMMKEYWPAD